MKTAKKRFTNFPSTFIITLFLGLLLFVLPSLVEASPELLKREEVVFADPLKEYFLFADSLKELLEHQDMVVLM